MAELRIVLCCLAVAGSFGCGPTRSQSRIIEASSELSAATTAQADQIAPYEFTAAEQYLRKAREEQSYAEYEVAERLAKRGRECAKLARMRAESGARSEIGASEIEIPAELKCRPGPAGTHQVQTVTKKKPAPAAGAKPTTPVKPVTREPDEPADPDAPPGELPDGEDGSGGGQ